ncbi:hypothetical protein U0070_025478 [Myodes glareolus]|uniref:M-phase phosphoprotein 9 n=1 Tax=Myodes glareolus TaxID=447135 RepID=A0AAW0HS24_MYOGA
MISKLETQVKQVEHENTLSLRHSARAPTRPSRAKRKWLIPGAEYSIFTGQPLDTRDRKTDNQLEESRVPGFDILLDDLDTVPVSTLQKTSPRKQLQFLPLDDSEEQKYSQKVSDNPVNHSSCPEPLPSGVKKVPARQAWEKSKSVSLEQCKPVSAALQGNDFEYTAKIRTLAETERFFDELTKEKDQIEAALSRMPSPGGRITLQTRLNQEALEDRLERINRELGSVRMTLKKFHILRSSANL